MGEVYLVEHPRLPRQEALKVLRPGISSDPSFRERFTREADLAAGLRHPHIVGIHDRGECEGHLWIAMDYVDGTDLAELVGQPFPAGMPVELVIPIVTAVASALDYAHKKGLLHRDVKPANIIVADLDTDDPNAVLADFGVARPLDDTGGITTTNMTVGTIAYAAPEQLMGEQIDGRADQYALAATTYHLLTGSQLFPHSNPAVVISHHLNAPMPALTDARPELAALDPVLAIGLAKNRDDRFGSCVDFAQALGDYASVKAASAADVTRAALKPSHLPLSDPPPTLGTRRISKPVAWILTGAATVAGLAAVALWGLNESPPELSAGGPTSPAPLPSVASDTAPPVDTTAPTLQAPPAVATTTPPAAATTTSVSTVNGAGDQQYDWRENHTWVCDTATGELCGNWTPAEVTFACKAIASGADYTTGLKNMLMSRYGMGDTDAFFLGKEAMYSVSSGGNINTGSMADGPHPLCNGIVP
jgi:serine/threonine-protein kinase